MLNSEFTQAYWLQSYFFVILIGAMANNINAIFPGSLSLFSNEFEERLHQVLLVVLMFVGCLLYAQQLVSTRRVVAHHGAFVCKRHEGVLAYRLVILMWIVSIVTILFNLWSVVLEWVFSECDGMVRVPQKEPHRSFLFASDYAFEFMFAIYVILQASWLHYKNLYETKYTKLCGFALFHGIVVNLALYVKLTLFEARETFEDIAGFDYYQSSGYTCGKHNLTTGLETIGGIHLNFVEVLGFAFGIESVLTLAVFAVTFHLEEAHEKNRHRHGGGGGEYVLGDTIEGLTLCHEANENRERRLIDNQNNHTSVQTAAEAPPAVIAGDFTITELCVKLGSTTAISGILVTLGAFAYGIYLFTRFTGTHHDLQHRHINMEDHTRFLIAEIISTGWILFVLGLTLRSQKQRSLRIAKHAQLDIQLLKIGECGIFALNIFTFIACASIWQSPTYHETEWLTLKILQGIFCVLEIAEVVAQVFYLSRALGYEAFKEDKTWSEEFFCVILLLVYNSIEWGLSLFARHYTFDSNIVASLFYNNMLWAVITEVCYPIAIFFRFHGVVLTLTLLGSHFRYKKRSDAAVDKAISAWFRLMRQNRFKQSRRATSLCNDIERKRVNDNEAESKALTETPRTTVIENDNP